jgi:branched-chain amino acid transport system ATP-binding protein
VLEVRAITVVFGGRTALDDVSLGVEPAGITALIGPNGAGKTTLFDVLTGLRRPDRGTVHLDGEDVSGWRPHARARRGLARTFQSLQLFGTLTARENIEAGVRSRHRREIERTTSQIVEFLGLASVVDEYAQRLPTGVARLVELGRALATGPSYLLLDEPASGLNEAETERFKDLIRTTAAGGVGVLLVEHDVPLVMDLCETIHVLDLGHMLASGPPAAIRDNRAVQDAYLGVPL